MDPDTNAVHDPRLVHSPYDELLRHGVRVPQLIAGWLLGAHTFLALVSMGEYQSFSLAALPVVAFLAGAALLVLTQKQRWVWLCSGMALVELALAFWWRSWLVGLFSLGILLLLIKQPGTLRTGLATALSGGLVLLQLGAVLSFYQYYL
ncbi:MAG: hypothetical protein H6510_12100 [Acidobacteria bacterium]|nr:hypothetical protein [Acidobacteriota bacterium]MCB9398548.1 hypothetical protein [Acidobacteriota bacterium]